MTLDLTNTTPETREYYALPAEIRVKAEELAGPIRQMTRLEILLAIGRGMMSEREAAKRGEG
ncbi:hypothetical protein [Sinorhizobium sp. BJ1]|uniref:hypothetical protein n=1 Tax=Sinorhizobium sp. BJ1 TaxID=2035455 RepID=UPI0032AEB012